MKRELTVRFTAVLLAVLTVAAILFAWFNLQKEQSLVVPYDGVWWMEREGSLRAERVDPNGPGENAGVKQGDVQIGRASCRERV